MNRTNLFERLRKGETIEIDFPDFVWFLIKMEKFPEQGVNFNLRIDEGKITISPIKKALYLNSAKLIFAGISLNILYGVLWKNWNLVKSLIKYLMLKIGSK